MPNKTMPSKTMPSKTGATKARARRAPRDGRRAGCTATQLALFDIDLLGAAQVGADAGQGDDDGA